jgi:flagellar basal-body rod modification protein FlgD
MTVTSATNPADIYSSIGINNPAATQGSNAAVGQDDFLRLMLEQLKNQDPLNPEKGAEFVAQLAQFSTVSGIEKLSASFAGMVDSMRGSQALSAAALVGRNVLVEGDTGFLPTGEAASVGGAVDVPASGSVQIEILDASGAVVRTMTMDNTPAGQAAFTWDGCNDAGARMASGKYTIRASVGGTAAATLVQARVDSVAIGASGAELMLAGLGSCPLTSVRQFN